MNPTRDALIVEDVLAGDKEAFGSLVHRYKKPLYNLAYRMTSNREDALDLSQEAFVRAYANLHRFDLKRSFFTWLYTICLNLTRNHLEKKRETLLDQTETLERQVRSAFPPADELVGKKQVTANLEKALQRLPLDLREAVILRYLQELSFEEITQVLGISLSAAKMRVYRGLEKAREAIAELGGKP